MSEFTTFINSLCYGDQQRFGDVFQAFLELERAPNIEDIGYNSSSGYVYIVLDNGITICEGFNGVEYLVSDSEGEEFFYGTYEGALAKINE